MACALSCYTSFVPQKSSGEVAFSIFVQKFKNKKKGIGIEIEIEIERRDAPKESFLPTTIETSKYRIEGGKGKMRNTYPSSFLSSASTSPPQIKLK
jgi:hypothetical protein